MNFTDDFLIHIPFFNNVECLEIANYINEKQNSLEKKQKSKIKSFDSIYEKKHNKNNCNVGNNASTQLYYSYNFFLDNPKYIPRLKKILKKEFPHLKYPLCVQSWANVYKKNQGISWHSHKFAENYFISGLVSNIFIDGNEDIGINYAVLDNKNPKFNYINVKNKKGYIQFVDVSMPHMVKPNPYDSPRYTIGITISEFDSAWAKMIINEYNDLHNYSRIKNSLLIIPESYSKIEYFN